MELSKCKAIHIITYEQLWTKLKGGFQPSEKMKFCYSLPVGIAGQANLTHFMMQLDKIMKGI